MFDSILYKRLYKQEKHTFSTLMAHRTDVLYHRVAFYRTRDGSISSIISLWIR